MQLAGHRGVERNLLGDVAEVLESERLGEAALPSLALVLVGLIPVILLISGVLGSIYSGVATATEAAAVGVVGSLVLAPAKPRASTSGALISRSALSKSVVSCSPTRC